MQTLAVVPLAGQRICLPNGVDHATAHAQLTALLGQAAGAEAAGLFGEPRRSASDIEFLAPDGRVARFDELDREGRTALRAEIGRLVSLLRKAAEKAAQRDPARCGSWPALVAGAIEIPTFELVYAHEGRPVLAGWGLAPAAAPAGLGLIRVLDDRQALEWSFVFPLWAAVLSLLALMALGAMAAVAAPLLVALFNAPEAVCRVAPGDRQAFLELDSERKREQELRRRLAALERSAGEKRAACPIPIVPAPAPPPVERAAPEIPKPSPPPQSPPPQKVQIEPPKPPPPSLPPPAPPPHQPPANTQPCNVERQSGGAGITETKHYLGPHPGRVRLQYDNAREPDRIIVYHKGRALAQTYGFTSGIGGLEFDWNPPRNGATNDYVVTVEVTGTPGSRSTIWRYNLGCPRS
jgi:hypothetical protein